MKYMGSKKWMLRNGLGSLLLKEAPRFERFVDLFSGSAAVSWFVAEHVPIPVLAVDLQEYAKVLAEGVLRRTEPVTKFRVGDSWLDATRTARVRTQIWRSWRSRGGVVSKASVQAARSLCAQLPLDRPITRAYGGHYFSPRQAITLDLLISKLPSQQPFHSLGAAAVIMAASKCSASPGHTAQPFGSSVSGRRYLTEAWDKDPLLETESFLHKLADRHALIPGSGRVQDAAVAASQLSETDLVFIDPPYSDVQYSRFYHVLETLARGTCGDVEGVGRYPSRSERPQSAFSLRGSSRTAFTRLMNELARAGANAIVTFPAAEASNGLSGDFVEEEAKRSFRVSRWVIDGQFSTLGGSPDGRAPRQASRELVLFLEAK